ncbi:DUF676-domain-containing protein [Dendrothele bispora CBS 962.96]|uniref:DUF676-domain-containing protein n=1 Tax=Dendrothele bispora (strain CBS 962.96) TaxID=1314807 RepID=A0A4S8MSA8_DENBC|nr:DUF676-domain-containing protein [Dendrothele bispora CBS 962.96]
MSSVHLLVLVHGMWGNPTHLKELHHEIKQKSAESGIELHTMLAETNQEDSTYDGIDWGGERVAQEIYAEIEELKKDGKQVTRFSITGYSLGGLVSRYVVGILLQKGFFDNVTPVNFNTLATPHLGLVRYPSFFSTVSSKLGPKLLSRTGEQFFASDKWSTTGRPLLDIMSDPDFVFYQALARFQTIRIYANATNDRTVPYVTAAIETEDPFAEHIFNGIEIQVDERYKPIIKSYHFPPESLLEKRKPFILTREWFDNRKKRPASLPPFLRFRFPLNILFYVAFPLLLPAVLSLAIIRFSRATRSSKARIKTLETDFPKGETLASMLGRLEHQMESAVVEMMEDPMLGASSFDNTIAIEDEGKGETTKFRRLEKDEHPVITPLQYKIAARMNKLPIKKEFAFLTDFNTHGTIICRDVERFAFREAGRGVIRHWADSLVV